MKKKQVLDNYVRETLALYGADLAEDNTIINARNVSTGIRIVQKGKRLRMEDKDTGALYFSGGCNAEAISHFLEKFWFWKKLK